MVEKKVTLVLSLLTLSLFLIGITSACPLGNSFFDFQHEECSYCGNNILEFGEQCDDGNFVDGDGCSSNCKIEICWDYDQDGICDEDDNCKFVWNPNQIDCDLDGKGDVCDSSNDCSVESYCGNGFLELGEECDDGNTNSGDGCSDTCEIECVCPECPVCGNGIVESGEECDGESNCTSKCKWEDDDCDDCSSGKKVFEWNFCESNWKCSGWSQCVNGIMTRECHDTNNCDLELNRPLEKTGCENLSKVYVEEENNIVWILIGIFIFLILLIILIKLLK